MENVYLYFSTKENKMHSYTMANFLFVQNIFLDTISDFIEQINKYVISLINKLIWNYESPT